MPRLSRAMANKAMVIRSPAVRSMSISLGEGVSVISAARAASSSVVFPIADATTTTSVSDRRVASTRSATAAILWTSATEEPPYF